MFHIDIRNDSKFKIRFFENVCPNQDGNSMNFGHRCTHINNGDAISEHSDEVLYHGILSWSSFFVCAEWRKAPLCRPETVIKFCELNGINSSSTRNHTLWELCAAQHSRQHLSTRWPHKIIANAALNSIRAVSIIVFNGYEPTTDLNWNMLQTNQLQETWFRIGFFQFFSA